MRPSSPEGLALALPAIGSLLGANAAGLALNLKRHEIFRFVILKPAAKTVRQDVNRSVREQLSAFYKGNNRVEKELQVFADEAQHAAYLSEASALTGGGNNPTSLDELQIGPPSGGGESAFGTVTSVAMTVPTGLTVTGSPITSASSSSSTAAAPPTPRSAP